MFKKLARFTVIGATVALISACGNYQGADDNMQGNGLRTNSDNRVDRLGTDRGGQHNDRNLRVNREVARDIERIDGVSRAHVVVGETNAYVAVELDGQGTTGGTTGGNAAGLNGQGNRGTDNGMTGSLSTRGTTTGDGRTGGLSSSITDHGAGPTGMNAYGNGEGGGLLGGLFGGMGNGNGTRFGAEPDLGAGNGPGTGTDAGLFGNPVGTGAGGGMNGTSPGAGLGTGTGGGLFGFGNGYGAQGTGPLGMYSGQSGRIGLNDTGMMGRRTNGGGANNDSNLAPTMRTMIDRTVRSNIPDIRNVYISTDPTFVQQMRGYTDRIGNGRGRNGMRGLANGFNDFVRTIFVEPFTNNDNDNFRNRGAVNNTIDNSFTRSNPRNTAR